MFFCVALGFDLYLFVLGCVVGSDGWVVFELLGVGGGGEVLGSVVECFLIVDGRIVEV